MDLVAFALSKKYTNDTADALGAVKGSPCTIKSAVHQNGRTTITFEWKGYSGQTEETQITVLDGTPIYEWQSGDQYNYSDLVIYASCFYRCITPNSDIEFDDTKWNEIGSPDGNYDIVQNSSLLPSIFTSADRKMYYSIEDQCFYLWNGTQWVAQKNVVQYTILPIASVIYENKIVQYIGTTNNTYTKGYFYQCVESVTPGEYEWQNIKTQDSISTASDVTYDNTNSGLEAENVQEAIDEVYGGLGTASSKDVAASGDASATEVVMGNDSRLTDARTPVAHTHTVSNITDFPASMPASDVYSWAKQENKPTYTANEVGAIPAIDKGANGGVAELDSNGKVPSGQLPSYVDDVIEGYYDSQTDRFYLEPTFETVIPPETGKVWVDIDTNKSYRWTGNVYTRVDEGVQLGETSSTAYRGDRGKTAYDHSQIVSGNPHNVTKSDVGLGNVGNFKAVSTEANQELTSTEQENARANIGAGTSSFDGAYSSLTGTPTLGTAAAKDVPVSGNASTTQVVMGDDTRLSDARNAADVYSWAKAENKPSYDADEVGAVSTTANQGLTTTEQANARDNIGLGSASVKDVPISGDASTTQVVMGDDTRLSDARQASDVYSWAKAENKPSYTASEVGAIATTAKGTANGVAELDANGKVPSSQLPSYVDDVIEGYLYEGSFYKDAQHTEQITGEASKIYVDLTTDSTYRWGGSAFSPVGSSLALGETSTTAYRGDRGKTAYDHSQVTSGNPHNVTKSDVGLGNVGNFKAVSTEASQGLSSTEQTNARANIGAGTSNFDGAYSSLSGTPVLKNVELGGLDCEIFDNSNPDGELHLYRYVPWDDFVNGYFTIDKNGLEFADWNDETHRLEHIYTYGPGEFSKIDKLIDYDSDDYDLEFLTSSNSSPKLKITDTDGDRQISISTEGISGSDLDGNDAFILNLTALNKISLFNTENTSEDMFYYNLGYDFSSQSPSDFKTFYTSKVFNGVDDNYYNQMDFGTMGMKFTQNGTVTAEATPQEIGYTHGVTSNIQTQLNSKIPTTNIITSIDTSAKLPTSNAVKTYVDNAITTNITNVLNTGF